MREKIIHDIKFRSLDFTSKHALYVLKKISPESYIDDVIEIVYALTRPKKRGKRSKSKGAMLCLMTELIVSIGNLVAAKGGLSLNTPLFAKIGAHVLFAFETAGLVKVIKTSGANSHAVYAVIVKNQLGIQLLYNQYKTEHIIKLPSVTPYAPWVGVIHDTGQKLVKTQSREVLSFIKIETHPLVFETVNKAQQIGWQINKEVLELERWALRTEAAAFNDIWGLLDKEAIKTKTREAVTINSMAGQLIDQTFYHLYSYDFRGRKYAASSYLHEQGADVAKGLLLFANKKAITQKGYIWLLINLANTWAGKSDREDGLKTDKISINDRISWARDNENLFISYADKPKENSGWMVADKPWQFIAACLELKKFKEYQAVHKDFSYETGFVMYLDGTNNGSQHLSALVRDEIVAPHVNITNNNLPGDLYTFIANALWSEIHNYVNDISEHNLNDINALIEEIIDIGRRIEASEGPQREQFIYIAQALRLEAKSYGDRVPAVFWSKITDPKHRRKIVKRNILSIPYGATEYGLGEQIITDSPKFGIELLRTLENSWASWLGKEVYHTCLKTIPRLMKLLHIFEEAGRNAEVQLRFLKWIVPLTNFPVVQHYVEGSVIKVYVQYGPPEGEKQSTGFYKNTFQLNVCCPEKPIPLCRKQGQGASPNIVHSLDAAHLMLVVHNSAFDVATVHDSYGASLADVDSLFRIIREEFYRLYVSEPLRQILLHIGVDISVVDFGNYNIKEILEAKYSFI